MNVIKRNWKKFLLFGLFWGVALVLFHQISNILFFQSIFAQFSKDFILGTFLTLITSVASYFLEDNRKRADSANQSIEENRKIISFNNEATKEAIKRMEDIIDSLMLEIRRIDTTLGDVPKLNDSFCDLRADLEKQKEKINANDRMDKLMGIIEKIIREQEQIKAKIDK